MKSSVITYWILLLLVTGGCSRDPYESGPSENDLRSRLATEFPAYVEVRSLDIRASDNVGDRIQPLFRTRFDGEIRLREDTFAEASREEGVIFVTPVLKAGEGRKIYGVSAATFKAGSWQIEFQFDADPLADLGRPRSLFSGGRTIVRGSEEEASFRAQQVREREARAQAARQVLSETASPTACSDTLVYYTFHGNGSDQCGGGQDGIPVNVTFAAAISCDGSTSMMRSRGGSGLHGNQPRTIAVWFQTTSSAPDMVLAGSGNYQVPRGGLALFANRSEGGSGAIGTNVGGPGSAYTAAGAFQPGAWTHAVMTYGGGDLSTVTFYVNGVAVSASVSDNTTPDTQDTALYVCAGLANRVFGHLSGSIGEVRVERRAWSANDVARYYASTRRVYQSR